MRIPFWASNTWKRGITAVWRNCNVATWRNCDVHNGPCSKQLRPWISLHELATRSYIQGRSCCHTIFLGAAWDSLSPRAEAMLLQRSLRRAASAESSQHPAQYGALFSVEHSAWGCSVTISLFLLAGNPPDLQQLPGSTAKPSSHFLDKFYTANLGEGLRAKHVLS